MIASFFGKSKAPEEEKDVKELEVPADTLGINILNPTPKGESRVQYDVDIIAVHGLGGDAFKTWTADNGKMWLRDFLPDDLKSGEDTDPCLARVMTFGYDVNVYSKAATQRSFTFAEDLLSALHDVRTGSSSRRPIIFIGHSLGGIVIKKALVLARLSPSYDDLLQSVRHLMFFGTPHQGTSSGADHIRSTGATLIRASGGSVLRELKLWSPWTIETNTNFAGIAEGFTITTFWEREPLHGVQVVNEGSARLNKMKEFVIGLDANHLTMCKFSSASGLYMKVYRRLSAEIVAIGTPIGEDENELRMRNLLESWFSPSNDTLRIPDSHVSENRMPGTNAWFLEGQIFHDWRAGNPRALWLHGGMGCGKTWLSTIVDEKLRHEPNPKNRVATCYFSNAPATTNARAVICSLLSQLGMRKLHPALRALHAELTKTPLVATPTTQQLEDTLLKVLKPDGAEGETFILVDAVDEIPFSTCRSQRAGIVRLLNTLAKSRTPRLRMLMTSRPDGDLIKVFASPQPTWKEYPIPDDVIQADIERYVRAVIEDATEEWNLDQTSQSEIIARLAGPKQTMFRLAALQLESLQTKLLLISSDIKTVLESLPHDLNAMYDKILQEQISENHRPLALKVLRWLAVSFRPLNVKEVSQMCSIPPESELGRATMLGQDRLTLKQLLNLLPNLVMLDSSSAAEEPSLVFAHFSVREYLTGSQLLEFPSAHFRIQLRKAHRLTATECLAYLYLSEKMGSNGDLEDYARKHWQLHAVTTGEMDEGTRRKAFFLSASVLFGSLAALEKELPRDFVRVTRWLENTDCIHELISILRPSTKHPRRTFLNVLSDKYRILAMLYPQDGRDSTIRCTVSAVSADFAPSYEAIHTPWDGANSNYTQKVQVNDFSLEVPDLTFRMLQDLRRNSTTIRVIWLGAICIDDKNLRTFANIIGGLGPEGIFGEAKRVVIRLGEGTENEKQEIPLKTIDSAWKLDPLFATTSTSEHREKQHPDNHLTALEAVLTKKMLYGIRFVRDIVFLCNSHELSLDDIRTSLPPEEGVTEYFDGAMHSVMQRIDSIPPYLSYRTFPHTRAMVDERMALGRRGIQRMFQGS